ncbi:MAG: hypothetical protein SFU86_20075 [Pirellulaceae bacterium]|nr:hypothetical protein [Pirellulaceae bacterium]
MHSYFVQSGPLKITIVAESAYDAALEAVKWWDGDAAAPDAQHRASLDAVTEVRSARSQRPSRLFPTFNLLARAAGESPSAAWTRVLEQHVGQPN